MKKFHNLVELWKNDEKYIVIQFIVCRKSGVLFCEGSPMELWLHRRMNLADLKSKMSAKDFVV